MNHSKRSIAIAILLTCVAFTAARCQQAPGSSAATNIPAFGTVDVTADTSTITPTAIIYTNAHMVAQNGATLDADEVRANLVPGGKVQNAVATGHVKAHIAQPTEKTDYNVTADKGVFDPQANRIDLTGNVRAVIQSPMTDGPVVQTGDSGEVYLGKGPDYPKLVMHHVLTHLKPATKSQ